MLFGEFADRFGWGPEQVGELDVLQVQGYMTYFKRRPIPYVQMMEVKT